MRAHPLIALAIAGLAASAQAAPLSDKALEPRVVERRAVEAVIWAMPAVNFDLMRQALIRDAKAAPNQIVYWSRLPEWKNQTLTPNPDAVYFMPFFDTREAGPMVIEVPPASAEGSITGNIDDAWQSALEDVGPAGVDKGKGGKLLILPPGYKDRVPDGYIPLQSDTFSGFALLRSILTGGSEAEVAKAWPTAGRSGCIRYRKPPVRRKPGLSMPSTWSMTPPSPMTCATSSR